MRRSRRRRSTRCTRRAPVNDDGDRLSAPHAAEPAVPPAVPAGSLARCARSPQRLVGCPGNPLGDDVEPGPAVTALTSSPAASSRECLQVAHSGEFELASAPRGAVGSGCVSNTPTGFPTERGGSPVPSDCSSRTIALVSGPGCGPPFHPLHHQVLGTLGHVGMQVVLQHPQRALLLPASAPHILASSSARTRAPVLSAPASSASSAASERSSSKRGTNALTCSTARSSAAVVRSGR